jgi:hypothetical protein
MSGWIKIHRTLIEWEWYDDLPTRATFIHLLITVNHAPKKWKGIDIGRGQRHTSIGKLAKECALTEKQIRTSLEKLQKTGEVVIQGASNGTMITVCKYDSYQSFSETEGEQTGKPRASGGQTEGEQRATNNKNKNLKNEEEEQEVKSAVAPTHPLTIWIAKACPSVAKMKQPLTDDEAVRLVIDLEIKTKAQGDALKTIVTQLENKPDLHKKYKSANLTIRKWWANAKKWEAEKDPTKTDPTIKATFTKGVYYR